MRCDDASQCDPIDSAMSGDTDKNQLDGHRICARIIILRIIAYIMVYSTIMQVIGNNNSDM